MKTCKLLTLLLVGTLMLTACGKSDAETEDKTPEKTVEMLTIEFRSMDKATDSTIQITAKEGKQMWMLNFAEQGVMQGTYDVMFDLEDRYDQLAKVAAENMPALDDNDDDGIGDYQIRIIYRFKTSDDEADTSTMQEIVLATDKASNLRPFLTKSNILHILPENVKMFPPTDMRFWYRDMPKPDVMMDKGPGSMDKMSAKSRKQKLIEAEESEE